MPVERVPWARSERDLWARIAAHSFEPEGQALTFTGRLARDHGWDIGSARNAVEAYRRFCFLAVTADSPMTPSEEVDEVWHQHLTFSRDYWECWCGAVLRVPLHHQPTVGGPTEARRFAEQYARTLARYETYFGPPDAATWPGVAQRFGSAPRFRIVDRDRALVLPVPRGLRRGTRRGLRVLGLSGLLSMLSARPAAALPVNVLDWAAGPFLMLYAILAGLAIAIALAVSVALRESPRAAIRTGDLSALELAALAGGLRRTADVVALDLMQAGHVSLSPDGRLVATPPVGPRSPASLAPFLERADPLTRRSLVRALRPCLDPVWDRLAADGLALSRADVARIRMVTACLLAPIVALGLVRMGVGLSRDRPVGFLAILVIATVLVGCWIASLQRLATAAGQRMLSDCEIRHARAVRAPLPDEILLAFAIAGPTALAGTGLAAYGELMARDSSDGGAGCGGDGGGGCGGCGGD